MESDAYPDLPNLEPQGRIDLGRFTGPGVIRTIHLTLNGGNSNREELLRGVFLEIEYEACGHKSVNAPVGDFFCDSFAGESKNFASLVMAKRPTNSLYCYIPMPFKKDIAISLVNKTNRRITGYGYVTAERIPEWDADFGYFHAGWLEKTFGLPDDTVPLLDTRGAGHFFGCQLIAVSSCPRFGENMGICEGNLEFYIDRSDKPGCNYLGTEDFFGFSWNWMKLWCDNYSGITYLSAKDETTRLACCRFLPNDSIRFSECLKAQINYRHELNNVPLMRAKEEANGGVHFGIVSYGYQNAPVNAHSG